MEGQPYYSGSTIPFTVPFPVSVENVIVHVINSENETVLAKFAYPELPDSNEVEGYATLAKSGNSYSGTIEGVDTEDITDGLLVMDIKAFVNDEWEPIGRCKIKSIAKTTVSKVRKW